MEMQVIMVNQQGIIFFNYISNGDHRKIKKPKKNKNENHP